jgi:hypothetical protein
MPSPVRDVAVRDGTTMWTKQIYDPGDYPYDVIKESQNKKLTEDGNPSERIRTGRWAGRKIWTLSLIARRTCARTCQHWVTCFDNNMRNAHRFEEGQALEDRIDLEVPLLLARHPEGVVIRLHVVGDFYSEQYVAVWREKLRRFPLLGLFIYTHRHPGTPIGDAILAMERAYPAQVAHRLSDWDGPGASFNGYEGEIEDAPATICPMQLGQVKSCASCGLCFNSTIDILVLDNNRVKQMKLAQRRAS